MIEQVKVCNIAALRAMAHNYADGHCWDHLDGNAVISAADEIVALQAECERLRETGSVDVFLALTGEIAALRAELAEIKAQQSSEPVTLAERMKAAGMLTVDEMIAGAPLDAFIAHAGVKDLATYGQWLEMKCREFLAMQAKRDLNKQEGDDLYEWVIAHAAVFQATRINFNAAIKAQEPVAWLIDWPDEPELGFYLSEESNELARSQPLYTLPVVNPQLTTD